MRKKPVSYEWFSYICISSQIRRKSRVVTHFLWKMVSEILIFLVVSYVGPPLFQSMGET
ncbi:hypothetical protein HanXRQr2_Chr09g0405971 [Helianthus annuus]|uniref:Uncharacterized protein n=1 Tax=Helianthus annuus TaxID=4232 RepID=A0A9K3I9M0_HELAN|nr:hypothetical protein HanXRQr2_Chr09g0405971 [Helianthus annuus]